ncbi:MAG: CBS domain-containing protein [Gammaproteobacteria bacterium]
MVRYEHSQLLSTPATAVWKAISDVTAWPALFAELVRVQVTHRSQETVQVTGTDIRARSFTMTVTNTVDEAGERSISAMLDADEAHFHGIRALTWTVTPDEKDTRLALKADYRKPLPLVGTLIARLRGRGHAEDRLRNAFDAAVRQSNEQAWNYQVTVQTILARKGGSVISAAPTDSVASIADLIHAHRVGAVLIRRGDSLVGLVSERDIVYQLSVQGPAVLERQAGDIMTRDLIVCEPQSDLLFVMACMTQNRIRHLPVMEKDRLVGVISIGDVVQQRMHSLEAESDTLKEYIAAREWRFHSQRGVTAGDTAAISTGVA